MTLSIVIVNYNVRYFLQQCLASVFGSDLLMADGSMLELDVWVVDNDSVDRSTEMVRREYPQVHLVENHDNVGFARANNQALSAIAAAASSTDGDCHLMLLLNPDTVVERDTFVRCADFMASHPACGGLTVKMVDGSGRFLPESKRGFPTVEASFYKISGLVRLFPHSKRVAAYYMGHLSEDEVNEIEIMCGAFLMLRRSVYDKIGGLDESYFMYGEDIDYSWRIRLAGWSNYYLPTTHIIHYKGESTKKGSMNYVYTFYNAMSIFVNRYYTGRSARLFGGLLHVAIWARAALAWMSRLASRLAVPVADFALSYGGFLLIKYLWETVQGYGHNYYPPLYAAMVIPLYILILMLCSWLHGGYDKPVRLWRIARGMGMGLLLVLAFYSLLDESQRYSRLLLLLGSVWTLVATVLVRLVLSAIGAKGYRLGAARNSATTIVVGQPEETSRVARLYEAAGRNTTHLCPTPDADARHLQDLIRIEHAQEVVFCGRDVDLRRIIDLMAQLRTTGVEYKIAPIDADFIVGSESVLSADDLYVSALDTISTDTGRRAKRTFDVTASLLLVILSPLIFWPQRRKRTFFSHCLAVLVGRRTWVGYTGHPGIFRPADLLKGARPVNESEVERLALGYMRHYRATTDLRILLRHWRDI